MTHYQKLLFSVFMVVWFGAAIHPVDPQEWFLENFLVFLLVGILFITAKHFKFSDTSYTLMTIFLVFHLIGSHYSYAHVPFGFTLQEWLHETRNMYDRMMHLLFGLAFTYPCYELTTRAMNTKRFTAYYGAFNMILAFSAIYEILEWLSVRTIDANPDIFFVGAQGDVWDGQKDMLLATIGALVTLGITFIARRYAKYQNTSH